MQPVVVILEAIEVFEGRYPFIETSESLGEGGALFGLIRRPQLDA